MPRIKTSNGQDILVSLQDTQILTNLGEYPGSCIWWGGRNKDVVYVTDAEQGHIRTVGSFLLGPAHRYVLQKNHRKHDFRRSNLITHCTRSQVCASRKPRHQYKGVRPQLNRFIAKIKHQGIEYYLGCFKTAAQAARAYNRRAKAIYGTCARLNNI